MTLEHASDRQDELPHEHSYVFKHAQESFGNGYKLDHDAMNVWSSLGYVIPALPQSLEKLKPRQHYEEYVRENDQKSNEGGEYTELVMKNSDPGAVAAFDALVDEFNADLDRIKREKDYAALAAFIARVKEVIYSKN